MRVFLSYATQDKPLARLVQKQLQDCGFEVWSDELIRVGQSIAEQVAEGINQSDAFVAILGAGTADRQWTSLEIGGALASGRPVVPVLADADARLPLLLGDIRALDLSDAATRAHQLPQLCEALTETGRTTRKSASAREMVERAREELEWEVGLYRRSQARDEARLRRMFLIAAVASVAATAVALVTFASHGASVISALATGLSALAAAIAGFYIGLDHGRDAKDSDEAQRQ